MFEIARFVVVAFVAVAFPVTMIFPLMVVDALETRPLVRMRTDVVALCPAAGWVKAS